jgi:hypothetical protein
LLQLLLLRHLLRNLQLLRLLLLQQQGPRLLWQGLDACACTT